MAKIRSGMLEILSDAIAAVVPRSSVRQRLEKEALDGGKVAIVAIGKAAAVMMESACDLFTERVADALLITSPAYAGSMKKDIVDTAVGAGSFETLVAAVQAAGLVDLIDPQLD